VNNNAANINALKDLGKNIPENISGGPRVIRSPQGKLRTYRPATAASFESLIKTAEINPLEIIAKMISHIDAAINSINEIEQLPEPAEQDQGNEQGQTQEESQQAEANPEEQYNAESALKMLSGKNHEELSNAISSNKDLAALVSNYFNQGTTSNV
jgi:hypothetical protein